MYVLLGILGGFLIGYIAGRWTVDDLSAINRNRNSKRQQRMDQLLKAVKKSDGLTSVEGSEILDVSERTVRNYLDELQAKGLVEQHGKKGPGVYYTVK